MGLFKKKKRKQFESTNDLHTVARILAENGVISVPKDNNHNTFGERIDKLDESGELPWGWIAHNREFTEKIESEFSYFSNQWIESRGKEPLIEYTTLKSLIAYIEDARKLCESKSECHIKWFIDCIAGSDYLQKRKADLSQLQFQINR